MRLPALIYAFVFLFSNKTEASLLKSVQSGNWNTGSTWDIGSIPNIGDTVQILPGDTIFINSSAANCNHLILEGVAFFKSSSNQLTTLECSLKNGEITGSNLGEFATDKLTVKENSKIGKCNLNINDSLIIIGHLDLTSASGQKSIKNLVNHGAISNSSNEDFHIVGNLTNNGIVEFKEGKCHFSAPSVLSGAWTFFRVSITDSLVVIDSLQINDQIEGFGFIENRGVLGLGMTNANFQIDSLRLSCPGNELILNRNGIQTIPKLSNNSFQTITFQNEGVFHSSENIKGKRINVLSGSEVNLKHEIVADSLVLKNTSTLKTYDYFNLNDINNLEIQKNSFLEINNDQFISKSLQVGNIKIEDGKELQYYFPDTLFVGGDFNQSGILKGSGIIYYNGSEKQTIKAKDYHQFIYANEGEDSSTFYGDFQIDTLTILRGKLKIGSLTINQSLIDSNGTIQIGGHAPTFEDSVNVFGELNIISNSAEPSFYWINILEKGSFTNQTTADITILNGINNNGSFDGCNGTACLYTFESPKAYLYGIDTINIPRIKAKKLYNHGITSISKAINIDSLINEKDALLLLQVDTQNINGQFDFSSLNNTLVLNKTGDQVLKENMVDFQNLKIANSGTKTIANDIIINNNLNLNPISVLKTDSFQITGNSDGTIIIDSAATFILGHNFSLNNITFPDEFKSFQIHDSSFVKYASKGDQWISSLPDYGNLIIDDGAITTCNKTITGDTLTIKGNLDLIESSLTLLANEKSINLRGDWNGPGAIKLTTGSFYIGGDGNADGELKAGNSNVVYNGVGRQRVKVGHYYNLTVNKNGHAYTRANTGSIIVSNNATVKKGTLEFSTEKCEIENLIIEDSVIFSSKLQDKFFENISVNPDGLFLLDIDEQIYINGNIENYGTMESTIGLINFSDSINNQNISGTGVYSLAQTALNKKYTTLTISSDLTLADTLKIVSGKTELNSTIQLVNLGFINGETAENNLWGNGKVSTNEVFLPGNYNNIGGLGINLTTATPLGNTLIERELKPAQIDEEESISRVYNIQPQFNSGLNASLSFNYWESELNGNIEDEAQVYKSIDEGTTWFNHSGNIDKISNLVSINGISSFSKWTIWSKPLTPLAVELSSFTGERENGNIHLNWEVLVEIGTAQYQINYSKDGVHFDSLCTIYPIADLNYFYTWKNAPNQVLFFELIEIETSGIKNRLDTIVVKPDLNETPKAWLENGIIQTTNFNVGTINLYDLNGKLIYKNKTNINDLPTGKYFIELLSPSNRWTFDVWKI